MDARRLRRCHGRGSRGRANIVDGVERVAVDLGAGLGTHTIALAEAGFRVIAIDTCASLLEALSRRSRSGLAISAVQADLQQFRQHSGGRVDVVACMGDTLTHLASRDGVNRLLQTKTLTVHDVVHERTSTGWTFRVSSYPKLRLSPTWVQSALSDLGLTVATGTTAQGMVRLAATRGHDSDNQVHSFFMGAPMIT